MSTPRDWELRLAALPTNATLQARIEAIVYCGRMSGEHQHDAGPYYCCEKVDALMALHRPILFDEFDEGMPEAMTRVM